MRIEPYNWFQKTGEDFAVLIGGWQSQHKEPKFGNAIIIPMARWSVLQAGFRLNPDNLFAPLEVILAVVPDRIAAPQIPLDEFIAADRHETAASRNNQVHRRD
jgi:hypothetical protein